MTEHTVTVTETVESEETVYTCDYCGLGDDAGEMIHYEMDSGDSQGLEALANRLNEGHDTIPDLHFHVSCIPKVVADDDQAEAITLKSQYDRRSGDSLLLVVTGMSLLFYGIAAVLWTVSTILGGWLGIVATGMAVLWTLLTLSLSYREARVTIQEFNA